MKKTEQMIAALLVAVLGVLFIVFRSGFLSTVVSIALTVLGVVLIVLGVLDLIARLVVPAVVKIVVGIAVIVFGWTLVNIVLYIVAALLIVYGVIGLVQVIQAHVKGKIFWETILLYAVPVLWIVLGIVLFVSGFSALDPLFIILGIAALIQAAVMFVTALKK